MTAADDFRRQDRVKHQRDLMADAAYEARCLKHLLAVMKMPKADLVIRRAQEVEDGTRELTFKRFHEVYFSFPIILRANRLPGVTLHTDKRAFLPKLFSAFPKVPFFDQYLNTVDGLYDSRDPRPIGMVFPRKGIPKGLVIHNGEHLDSRYTNGVTLTFQVETGRRIFVQPYINLLTAIYNAGDGWHPE